MEIFKKMWPEAWGVRKEYILRNVLMALLEQPDATLHDVLCMLCDQDFRKEAAKHPLNRGRHLLPEGTVGSDKLFELIEHDDPSF
jgi:hypothetical protein